MKVLLSVEVWPYMAQVALADPTVRDYPVPEADEEVFVTPHTVAVATRSDYMDGDLRHLPVEVWLDDGHLDGLPPGQLIYEGEVSFDGDEAELGNYMAGDTHRLAILSGRYGVRVLREPSSPPAEVVRFVIEGPRA
jgi:hypothetical protein